MARSLISEFKRPQLSESGISILAVKNELHRCASTALYAQSGCVMQDVRKSGQSKEKRATRRVIPC